MTLPPTLLYVRHDSPERRGIGVWLPLFLIWLVLLPFVLVALLVTALVDTVLFLSWRSYHHYTLLLLRALGLLGELRGLTVHIQSKNDVVDIDVV